MLSVIAIWSGIILIVAKETQKRAVVPEAPEPVPAPQPVIPEDIPLREEASDDDVEFIEIRPSRSDIARNVPGTFVVIDKSDYTMEVFNDGEPIKEYHIAVGKNLGDKQRVGDMRTPEGDFPVVQIQDSSSWTYDFRDGKGPIRGAYGPYFIRLGTPGWTGIGIHGTHAPDSIGTNVTEGCIRLNNNDLAELRRIVKIGDRVVIRD